MSRVSVLIPNFNGAKWLKTTIQSCLTQKDLLEIIVIDDGSSDESMKVLEEIKSNHPDIIKIFKNQLKGGNNARNYAYSLSVGEFIQWLDADDQLNDGKFAAQIKLFDSDHQIDIVYSDWELLTYDKNLNIIRKEIMKKDKSVDFLNDLLLDNWSPPICYLLRRGAADTLHNLKAWNPDTNVNQDKEYFTIAAILGFKFDYTAGVFSTYNRWNANSVSAVNTKVRYATTENILNRFLLLINEKSQLTIEKKNSYREIIHTEKILLRALGQPTVIQDQVQWKRIKWSMIKGFRTNLKFLWQALKLKWR